VSSSSPSAWIHGFWSGLLADVMVGPGFEVLTVFTIRVKAPTASLDILPRRQVGEMARRARGGAFVPSISDASASLANSPMPQIALPLRRRKLLASPRRCVGGTGEWPSLASHPVD